MMSTTQESFYQWKFTENDFMYTPSRRDGISLEDERTRRAKGCFFLAQLGGSLKVSQTVIASACYFFHRFYMRFSFKNNHHYDVAAACFYLSTKTQENCRHFDDIISETIRKCQKEKAGLSINKDDKEFLNWKAVIIYYEEMVLDANCFDLDIIFPYKFLTQFTKLFDCSPEVMRSAWAFINDSLRSTVVLTHSPEVIAAASIFIASEYLDEPLPTSDEFQENWWNMIHVPISSIKEASNIILDIYSGLDNAPSSNS